MTKSRRYVLAFDLGATSGRCMLAEIYEKKATLTEIHRFLNEPVTLNGDMYWDFPRLMFEIYEALKKAAKLNINIESIGIDTWGVDFGLLDKNGRLCAMPRHYRDKAFTGMTEKAFSVLSKEEIFNNTGLAFLDLNTLYQLYTLKLEDESLLNRAETLLFMPDLIAYYLTGEMKNEYTISTTSQIIDPKTRSWSNNIISAFGFKRQMFKQIAEPGTLLGYLTDEITSMTGIKKLPVYSVASHDTASAVLAVPALDDEFMYISSGTWSLMGTEVDTPLTDKSVMDVNYTNEGGVFGTTRLLKNLVGLWMIEELKREFENEDGKKISYAEITQMVESAAPFKGVIDVNGGDFTLPGHMSSRINAYLSATGQNTLTTRGEFFRVAYEGISLLYAVTMKELEGITGKSFKALNIVGGGSKAQVLNQMASNACNLTVYAGPDEGTALGNALMQAYGLNIVSGKKEIRELVKNSFEIKSYSPNNEAESFKTAVKKLEELIQKRK